MATPGRLADHLTNDLECVEACRKLKFLVLDEADRLLDGQYSDDVSLYCQFIAQSHYV